MPKRIRLPLFGAGVIGLFVVACSEDQDHLQAAQENVADAGNASPVDAGFIPSIPGLEVTCDTADPNSIGVIDLGTHTLSAVGRVDDVPFTLPANVTSFMVSAEAEFDVYLGVHRLEGPEGELVRNRSNLDQQTKNQLDLATAGFSAQFVSPNRISVNRGVTGAQIPNNPQVRVVPGDYLISLRALLATNGSPYTGELNLKIYYRLGDPGRGNLQVVMHFTGANGLTSETAPQDPFIQDSLNRLREIYAQANIDICAVKYKDVDARYQTIEQSSGDLEMMFTNSELPGLHFYFIERFSGREGRGLAGVAGGIPGPPRLPNSYASGVAVALNSAFGDPDVLGHVMAHEGGHWLGLYHTSEFFGFNDQHPATPVGLAGESYLMFPAVGGGTTLSQSQGDVMRRHLEVQGE